jgi:hypothetical protein
VLHSPQLEKPISLPFMALSHLTTERVLAQIERVIQSNHEFRLNDSVTRLADDLHEKAVVPIGSCGIEEVKQFQAYLTDYQINIVSKEHQNSVIFSGPDKEKRIYLFLHDTHFDAITSMPAFVARKMYCHTCKKGYDHQRDHLCGDTCKLCHFQNCPIVSCSDCNRDFM